MSTESRQDYTFFQGEIIKTENANVSVKTHALQYGTACFGGIRGYWNEKDKQLYVFKLKDHYKRIFNSAKILMMKPAYTIDELCNITLDLIRKNEWKQHVYLRPFLYKSELSLSPRLHDVKDDFTIYTLPLNDYLDVNNGLKCKVSSWVRIADNTIPGRAKASGGYINSALAKSDVILDGYDEAIFLGQNGNVSEGSAENIFIVRNGQVITPPVYSSILEGITRNTVIELLRNDLGLEVIEREINRTELYVADEAFFCGTGVQVAWIREIDHRPISDGKIGSITSKIQKLYFDVVQGEVDKYKHWLTAVY